MEHITLQHAPDDLRRPLTPGDIAAVCRRAFGGGARVESAREPDGGEYNTTYLVRVAGMDPVILRVAPPPDARLSWHEQALMRKEQAVAPYFAPIAALMPRTLMADFTRGLIDRDYVFQTYIRGERWSAVEDSLTPAEDEALWRQFARIARTIHSVEGEGFGYPHPGPTFPSWGATVRDFVARVCVEVEEAGLDTADILAVRRVAEDNRAVFDAIARPRLAHGDLWPFNMLIERGADRPDGPAIVAVIDADRAWWCDPLADWTSHLFRIKDSPRALRNRATFWDEYGPRDKGAAARLRELVYDGMHTAAILSDATRRNHHRTAAEARDRLHAVATALHDTALL